MTGNTHISIGIAASLLLFRPATVPICLSAVVGGMAGAAISDIDHQTGSTTSEFSRKDVIHLILVIIGILGLDYIFGNGMNDYMGTHFGPLLWGGAAIFLISIIVGNGNKTHHTYMHSLQDKLSHQSQYDQSVC